MSSLRETSRPAGPYHEMLDASGRVRPHWRAFHRKLIGGGPEPLEARREQLARQIQENGITYNVYADPLGTDRPWELDLLPNLIPADEWQALATGVAQRARLLDALLADIYGPQRMLAEGLLPAELVFGHENFLWPCQGIQPPGGAFLHVYAADLRRAPDGRWWVIADRTQAPSGAGYALENRQIVSRLFPEAFRQLRVQHMAGYFRTLRETLMSQAPRELGETPLVVLLTPGRFNETYFEHLYLARQLGFPLVEGSDLTVRDATLYLKTLDGLQRVHGVLRRLDDDFCDPLELRADSALGVPGLLEAVRQGRVLVANALGSGVLESPGLLGFLPKIAQRLLGESLTLPSIATWWCGEAPVLDQALERLDRLMVRPAFPSQRFAPVFGGDLDAEGLERLAERLRARPYAYVAQEVAHLSQAPVWLDGELQSRAIGMRVYAVASPWGYQVMPGGLTRVAGDSGAQEVTMQTGGGSKDTWVLAGREARGEPLAPRILGAAQVIRRDPYLPSRVVENLYWFGRYAERCDDLTRLLRVVLSRYLGDDDAPAALTAAVQLAEGMGVLADAEAGALEDRLFQALLGEDWATGLRANLQRLNWTAAQVRGRLSQENWLTLMDIQREAHTLERKDAAFGELLEFLDRLLRTLSGLSGFAFDDMTRDDGWRFLMLGRRIERLQFLCEAISGFLAGNDPQDQAALDWLLELGNSTLTYRSRYLAVPQVIPVLDLLLLDEQNPHAVLFQLLKVQGGLAHLGQQFDDPAADAELGGLVARLRGVDLGALESPLFGNSGLREVFDGLGRLLLEVSATVGQLSDRLALRHFAHVDASRQTVSL